MKKGLLQKTLALGILVFALHTKAQENSGEKFDCSQGTDFGFIVTNQTNAESGAAEVAMFEDDRFWTKYPATFKKNESSFFKSYDYEIFKGGIKIGTLQISSHPPLITRGGCRGRGACDIPPTVSTLITEAYLSLAEHEGTFNCK